MFNILLLKKIKCLFFAGFIFCFFNISCGLKNNPQPPTKSLVK